MNKSQIQEFDVIFAFKGSIFSFSLWKIFVALNQNISTKDEFFHLLDILVQMILIL